MDSIPAQNPCPCLQETASSPTKKRSLTPESQEDQIISKHAKHCQGCSPTRASSTIDDDNASSPLGSNKSYPRRFQDSTAVEQNNQHFLAESSACGDGGHLCYDSEQEYYELVDELERRGDKSYNWWPYPHRCPYRHQVLGMMRSKIARLRAGIITPNTSSPSPPNKRRQKPAAPIPQKIVPGFQWTPFHVLYAEAEEKGKPPDLPHLGPPCPKCKAQSHLRITSSYNTKGNANRPYYRCQPCDKFVTWADLKDVVGPYLCYCGNRCRELVTTRGVKNWKCPDAICNFDYYGH